MNPLYTESELEGLMRQATPRLSVALTVAMS
jgi:hypothetical protein